MTFRRSPLPAPAPLILTVCLLLVATACTPPLKELSDETEAASNDRAADAPKAADIKLPVDRTIHDINGRPLEVKIQSRSGDQVRMVRREDNYIFDFPIPQLSTTDRQFILQFPESFLSPIDQNPAAAGPEASENAPASELPPYIRTRVESIAELTETIAILRAEVSAISPGNSRSRMKERNIEQLAAEIIRFETQIATYRKQNHIEN